MSCPISFSLVVTIPPRRLVCPPCSLPHFCYLLDAMMPCVWSDGEKTLANGLLSLLLLQGNQAHVLANFVLACVTIPHTPSSHSHHALHLTLDAAPMARPFLPTATISLAPSHPLLLNSELSMPSRTENKFSEICYPSVVDPFCFLVCTKIGWTELEPKNVEMYVVVSRIRNMDSIETICSCLKYDVSAALLPASVCPWWFRRLGWFG
jgi:hypothetical protein